MQQHFCVTDRAAVQPTGCRLSLRLQTLTYNQTAIRSSGLPLNPRNPCNYYSTTNPKGLEGWVGLVGWPIVDTLLTKWSHVNHISEKVRQPKTDILTTEPRRQTFKSHLNIHPTRVSNFLYSDPQINACSRVSSNAKHSVYDVRVSNE